MLLSWAGYSIGHGKLIHFFFQVRIYIYVWVSFVFVLHFFFSLSLEALFLLLNNTLCDFLSSVGSPFVSLVCVCVCSMVSFFF